MFKYHIVDFLGFTPSAIDTKMYYQRNTKENGTDYYKLLLVYVEDVLACSHNAKAVMAVIAKTFDINNDEIAEPKLYLGGNVDKFQLPNGKHALSITFNSYVQVAIDTVQRLLLEDVNTLKTINRPHKFPLPHGYKSELDTTDECDSEHISRYQQLIGIFQWDV